MKRFNVGETVTVKGIPGPEMLVTKRDDFMYFLLWFVDGKAQTIRLDGPLLACVPPKAETIDFNALRASDQRAACDVRAKLIKDREGYAYSLTLAASLRDLCK